jgi:hypothetical protein
METFIDDWTFKTRSQYLLNPSADAEVDATMKDPDTWCMYQPYGIFTYNTECNLVDWDEDEYSKFIKTLEKVFVVVEADSHYGVLKHLVVVLKN